MSNRDSRPIIALEVSTMGERNHTGIPNVAKSIAREMLLDDSIDARFFISRAEAPRAIIERLVELETGDILWWLSTRLNSRPSFEVPLSRPLVAIYPGPKRHRRLFPIEVLIVYDLTTVITPQFHTRETVEFHQSTMLGDMLTSDLLVAISESTKADIRAYLPQVDHIPCETVHLASSVEALPKSVLTGECEDYVLILGTIEPRKNVKFVFECLSEHPELLSQYKFVFAGRWGWGEDAQRLLLIHDLVDAAASGRIVFTGFVSDVARDALMARARVVVYPSRYEGFGLPVIEALSLGTPVITSYSSSLPEVGGDVVTYCDIDNARELYRALLKVSARRGVSADSERTARKVRTDWARTFSWKDTFKRIKDAALDLAEVDSIGVDRTL